MKCKRYWNRTFAYPMCRSVCLESVLCQNGWLDRMPFGVVSAVGRRMDVLDGVVIIEGEGQFWG